MKKLIMGILLFTTIISLSAPLTAKASARPGGSQTTTDSMQEMMREVKTGWNKDSSGWWYHRSDGSFPKNKWEKINGKWYHFDARGYMQTGWLKDGGKWYYLKPDGAMAQNESLQIGGKWYRFSASGEWAQSMDAYGSWVSYQPTY